MSQIAQNRRQSEPNSQRKVVLGLGTPSSEGRACNVEGKAPITGPYTRKWRLMMRKGMLIVGVQLLDEEDGF